MHAQAVFEPAIPASEQPQTHALDRAATGIDRIMSYKSLNVSLIREALQIGGIGGFTTPVVTTNSYLLGCVRISVF